MADSLSVLTVFASSLLIKQVDAYYCDSGKCENNEYCCGENICCVSYTVWELWYFWFGLVFFMILLTSCIYMWRSGYRERIIYFGTVPPSYSPLSHKEAHLQTSRYSDDFGPLSGNPRMSPPAYDEVIVHGYHQKLPQ
ncbi:uncharacterized protein LOC133194119 [Saccostrea echinata]|uniref:uncharacterized protein LOC133194119 n=1 Tax=Saccostrea echinata TaxID=191078 RepID=UPI002A7F9768|nr:uncharacterized protein LOC133194119 [Saccostrea echinata]